MKVKDLIEALSKADPDLEVCFFDDYTSGPSCVDSIGVYVGNHEYECVKAIRNMDFGKFVGLGWPEDKYDVPPNLIEDIY